MCLSTVYKIERKPENEILKNVMLISSHEGKMTFTDIMGREEEYEGEVVSADLTGGYVIVAPRS